jgi:glycosyltransferase involved in cell wall biosynthesis
LNYGRLDQRSIRCGESLNFLTQQAVFFFLIAAGSRAMKSGKVAVLLSTYNGDKYLDEYLQSLRRQEWSDITLIVRDDGSSDKTLQILKRYQGIPKFNLLILSSNGNLGPAQSYFRLLDEAGDGFDYYAFSDQDDVWLPEKITRAVDKLKPVSRNVPALYCSRLEYVDEDLNHIQWSRIPHRIGYGNAIVENIATGCTLVLNKSARELILHRIPRICLMHDWWCYLLVTCFGQVVFDDHPGIKYRLHRGNTIGAATSFTDDVRRRVIRFTRSDGGVFRFSDQVKSFIDTFEDRIPEEKRGILSLVISSKSSSKDRVRLAGSGAIWRQRKLDDAIMRILILLNRY